MAVVDAVVVARGGGVPGAFGALWAAVLVGFGDEAVAVVGAGTVLVLSDAMNESTDGS